MTRPLFTAALLVAALVLYALGLDGGGTALLIAGAACELWFWVRVVPGWGWMGRDKPTDSSTKV